MKFLRMNDVKALTGLGRSTIYKHIKLGIFPAAAKLGGRSVAWVESEVQAWIVERIRERDQQTPMAVR
jgi:prophage regulatory protein